MLSDEEIGELPLQRTKSEIFSDNMSLGLHAVAQPLTILRASLWKTHTDQMGLEDLRELAASSAVEIERVCNQFNWLRQILSTEVLAPELVELPIVPLLSSVTDGFKRGFEQEGVSLRLIAPRTSLLVLIDSGRTTSALASLLLVARGLSRKGDTIDLILTDDLGEAHVVVRNLTSQVDTLNTEWKLSLALAGANIRSQDGSLSWSLNPFCAKVDLLTVRHAA